MEVDKVKEETDVLISYPAGRYIERITFDRCCIWDVQKVIAEYEEKYNTKTQFQQGQKLLYVVSSTPESLTLSVMMSDCNGEICNADMVNASHWNEIHTVFSQR